MAQRPTLYLLPGLLCDAYTYAHQKRALEGEFDVRVLDFFGLDSMTAMAERVLNEAPERFSVCGFSMGGRVALQIFRLAPERMERLCLLDTGVTAAAPGEAEKRQALVDLAWKEGMDALVRTWLPPMLHPDRREDPAFTGPLGDMIRRASPDIFEKQIRALVNRPDPGPLLPTINFPTVVAVGRQDEWSTVEQHEDFAKLIPNARMVVIEDSGHFTPVEQPDALTAILREMMAMNAA
jgi:pimeloyl-ACP methyl ester carboxylesterase